MQIRLFQVLIVIFMFVVYVFLCSSYYELLLTYAKSLFCLLSLYLREISCHFSFEAQFFDSDLLPDWNNELIFKNLYKFIVSD